MYPLEHTFERMPVRTASGLVATGALFPTSISHNAYRDEDVPTHILPQCRFVRALLATLSGAACSGGSLQAINVWKMLYRASDAW